MITVVNIVPRSLSGETNQDSEPNIAVNPANPMQIAASAFTPAPMGGANAPIYVSTDGGSTWTLNSIVPSAGSIGTGDITLRFAGSSSRLFAAILDGATGAFEVHRTTDFTSPTAMTQLESRADEDQPYVQATTVAGGADAGKDRAYIGVNDFNATGGQTATLEQTLNGGVATPAFSSIRLEKRSTLGQNGPQVRPAVHGDGTVYAAFYRWISSSGSFGANTLVITDAELIVARDDQWGSGATPFTALTDPADSLAGRRVATGLSFPFNQTGVAANGQERWGGDISIAVDPRNSSTVYVAYSTRVSGTYTLMVTRSLDRGVTWAGTLLSIANATNPALAINSLGRVALVSQQLSGSGATQRWETHFRDTSDGTTWTDTVLCTALAQTPARSFSPYLGDYLHMMAAGKDFYGIFSANNTPDLANFPQGVTYQRNHDFAARKLFALDGVTVVNPSIDPFFFKVTQIDSETGSDFYVRDWTDSASVHDTGLEPSSHPVFYATSDVWNQRSSVAPTYVSDQPQNQDPQNNATNHAFARISRNAAGAAQKVKVEFLVAEFGTGSPYRRIATTTASFAAADTSKIVKASWTLPATSSTHLCLAVQISAAADPFVTPGLQGNTPGWPTTDLLVINDNNKAQRNMSVHYGLSGFGSRHYAIVRNASTKTREMLLRLGASAEAIKALAKPKLLVQGGRAGASFKDGAEITLSGMAAGESRWIALDLGAWRGKAGQLLPVDLFEMIDGKTINGFRIAMSAAQPAVALRELTMQNAAVFQRLQKQFKVAAAADVVTASGKLLKTKTITLAAYQKALVAMRDAMSASVEKFLGTEGRDQGLDIAASMQALTSAARARSGGKAFAANVTLVNQIDVAMTLLRVNGKR